MDPLARRRSSRQEPDAVDDDQVRALQSAEDHTAPIKSGSSTSGKSKKAAQKKQKEVDKKDDVSASSNPGTSSGPEAGFSDSAGLNAGQGAHTESALDAASEEMQSPEPVSPHPFWSERAKMEVALAKARPISLDHEALRFAEENEGTERPADLDHRAQIRKELRVDEEFLEPPYESFHKEVEDKATLAPQATGATSRFELEDGKSVVPERVSPPVQKVEGVLSSEVVQNAPNCRRIGDVVEEQALEIAQLRSLVDHLQGALTQVEETRSPSNPGGLSYRNLLHFPLGAQDHFGNVWV